MFDFIEGAVRARTPSAVVLDVGGVGYRLQIPLSTYERVPLQGSMRLLTRLVVQEDQIRLFGFATAEERRLFEDLIQSASRVGPVKALAILSSAAVGEIQSAIVRGDVSFLKRIRGVGEKIAQRLVVELKDRVGTAPAGAEGAAPGGVSGEAVRALEALGYGPREAEEAVRAAAAEAGPAAPVAAVVKRALQGRR